MIVLIVVFCMQSEVELHTSIRHSSHRLIAKSSLHGSDLTLIRRLHA